MTVGARFAPPYPPIAPVPTTAVFAVHDLSARRGTSLLWQRLSFSLHEGDALVVRGANGAGKTTLLRVLAGLTHAEDGFVEWRGIRLRAFAQALRNDALYIGHAPALKDAMTAHENLASLATLAAEDAPAPAITAALAATGLAAQAALPARVLSQGQRRRVQLALLPLSTRPLWILDEPDTALDAQGLAWLAETLSSHCARGGLLVMATHHPLRLEGARVTEIAL